MLSNFCKRYLSIRKAGPDDCEFVVTLEQKLAQMVLKTKKMPIIEGIREQYHEMMKDPEHYFLFIAEEKDKTGKPVKLGVAITSSSIMLFNGGPCIDLQELIVDDSARGKGIGSALIKHVIQYSKDHGFFAIDLVQPPDSDKYHEKRTKFYTENGFEMGGRYRFMELKDCIKIVD